VSGLPWPKVGGQFEYGGHQYSWNFKDTVLKREDGEVVGSVHDWDLKYGRLEIHDAGKDIIDVIAATFLLVWETVKGFHFLYFKINF